MNVLDSARVIIYRVNKKGLEIFLVHTGGKETEKWNIPVGKLNAKSQSDLLALHNAIQLEPAEGDAAGQASLALEGDWHEIPSIRALLKEDVRIVKDHVKDQLIQKIPDLEQGSFVAIKEAFKKVMPEEYAVLKELKDVLLDRNQAFYI